MRETSIFNKQNSLSSSKGIKKIVEPCTSLKVLVVLFSIMLKFTRTNQTFETNNFVFKGVLERLQPYTNKLQDTKESHVNNKKLRVNVSN